MDFIFYWLYIYIYDPIRFLLFENNVFLKHKF